MRNETEGVTQNPERTLYGKVMGVLKYRDQLKSLCDSLTLLGIREVEVLDGLSGRKRLQTWNTAVSPFIFGDMEVEMMQRYLDAVVGEFIVFAAVVESDLADKAAELAKLQGATDVVHFGNSVVTNY